MNKDFINRGDADFSTLVWEKLGTSLDSGLKDKVRSFLLQTIEILKLSTW